jgi:hypothetical protein
MNHEMTPVLKSWQFFLSCRRVLGDSFLTVLYNRGQRQIYRWSADPDFTDPAGAERNPIDRLKTILERLAERGRQDIALSGLSILAAAIGCEVQPFGITVPDKNTVEDEMLDDYPALIALHNHIRSKESIPTIQHHAAQAKRDIDETVQKYINGVNP